MRSPCHANDLTNSTTGRNAQSLCRAQLSQACSPKFTHTNPRRPKIFNQERTTGAARLMYCILFTALCGSFVKDANYKSLRIVDKIHDPAEAQAMEAGGRFIDDRLPSSRLPELLAWMGNYVERGGKIPEEWTDNWELVCSAHRHLWGTTPVDEIRMDIASDQRLIEQIAEGDPTLKVEAHPFNCFVDLVRIRSTLADLLD